MKRIVCASIPLALFASLVFGQQLQLSRITDAGIGDDGAVVQIDLKKYALKVISTSRLMSNRGWTDPTPAKLGPMLGSGDFVLTGGGLNRAEPLDPAGLLVADSKVLSPLAYSKGKRNEVAGVLCVSIGGVPSILTIQEYVERRASCAGAIQAGPIVILERDPVLAEMPDPKQDSVSLARLVACESRDASNRFAFYFFRSATIARVKQALQAHCKSAINLVGSEGASISIWNKGSMTDSIGGVNTPLPSMIQATPR